jgi:hypothetical protein
MLQSSIDSDDPLSELKQTVRTKQKNRKIIGYGVCGLSIFLLLVIVAFILKGDKGENTPIEPHDNTQIDALLSSKPEGLDYHIDFWDSMHPLNFTYLDYYYERAYNQTTATKDEKVSMWDKSKTQG